MSDFAPYDEHGKQAQRRLALEFVREVSTDLDSLGATASELEAGDVVAWRRAQMVAHVIIQRAHILQLGVLESFARELAAFSSLIVDGAARAKSGTLQNAMVALDTIRLELQSLTAKLDPD